jgi:hypothetical protein
MLMLMLMLVLMLTLTLTPTPALTTTLLPPHASPHKSTPAQTPNPRRTSLLPLRIRIRSSAHLPLSLGQPTKARRPPPACSSSEVPVPRSNPF